MHQEGGVACKETDQTLREPGTHYGEFRIFTALKDFLFFYSAQLALALALS